ncbi:MAG: hypothetical protein E7043_09025 [Lentisphaerae bacterium]|nr:hypothetical protein [Lentisphaerota bacterium]
MKKWKLMLAALAGCFAACGAEYGFAKDKNGEYGLWSSSVAKAPFKVQLAPGAGVDGSDALVINDIGSKSCKLALDNLYFIPGRKYKIGGWVKTENVKTRRIRFVLHNRHWRRDISTRNFPASTKGKWTKFEYTGVMMDSGDGVYTFGVHIDTPQGGKLELSKLFVEEIKPENQLTPVSYSFPEKTDPDLKGGQDPDFRKLTDGASFTDAVFWRAREGKSVTWRHKHNKGKGPVITFNFDKPVSLETIKVYYSRNTNSYGIKEIRVTGVADGQRILAGNIVLNHPYTKPKTDPSFDVAEIESATDQKFTQVELSFIPTGGWISLNEVEFFGKAEAAAPAAPEAPAPAPAEAKKKTEPAGKHPYADELISTPGGLRLIQKKDMIAISNDMAVYAIDPAWSGAVNFAYDRESKTNMALPSSYGFGLMFSDRVYPGGYDIRDMFRQVAYDTEIIADTPQKKQVKVSGIGRNGIFRNVRMERIYTLYANSPVLHVEQTISNGKDNVIPLRYGYWMCGGAQSPNGYKLIVPGSTSVEIYKSTSQLTVRDISSGWMAAKDENSDNSLALMMPYDLLSEFYFWPSNKFAGTMEFKLGIYPIKAGENLKFNMALVPYSKIGIPAKVTRTAALSFGDLPTDPTLKVQIFDPQAYTLRLSAGFVNNGKVQFKELLSKSIPANARRFETGYKLPAGKGTLVLKAELLQNNTAVMTAEASTIIGSSSGIYTLTPDCERKPDISAGQSKANLDFHSYEVVTPHIKWGKPFAGNKLKVLSVNFRAGGIREMVELGQRFDIDLTTNYVAGLWTLSGYVMSLSVKDCINQLSDKLKTQYDVILISGSLWQNIPAAISDAIMAQVANGTGLIVISPDKMPQSLQKFFTKASSSQRGAVQWAAVPGKNIFSGIPFDIMPKVRNTTYKLNGGEVLATAGDAPLIASFDHGKGKIFLAAYQGKVPRSSKSSTFFLPSVIDDDPRLDWHYYEYYHMMLAKMMYAAAGKNTGVAVDAISAVPGTLNLEIQADKAIDSVVEVTLRDKFSREVGVVREKAKLDSGKNIIKVSLPQAVLNGLHFTDTTISTAKGKVWWGTACFNNESADRFVKADVERRIYQQNDNIAPVLEIAGSGEVTTNLYDCDNNLFATAKGLTPSLPLTDCLSAAAKIEVLLHKDGKEVDRFVREIDIFRKPDARFFQIAQGWPSVVEKAPLYLTDKYTSMLKEHYFVNSTGGSSVSWDNAAVTHSFRKNGILFISQEFGIGTGGKYPFDRDLKSKNKFDLIRTPCLSNPAFLEKLRTSQEKMEGDAARYGAILGAGADEANMFGGWDGCFSPDCMRELRIYLKNVYGSLDALNQSWQTQFASWDEVVPMTLPEARKHTSLAPWMDHRTFNDYQRAKALGIQTAAVEKHQGIWVSLSGTSDTNPWNAWDYYLIMPHMKAIAGYFGEQTIQHRSFAKTKLAAMPWIGYDVPYDEHNMQINRALMNGVSGLNIYGSFFYFAPDWTVPVAGLELKKLLSRYLNGKADLIMHFDASVYPIAMHYSPASIKVDYVLNHNELRKSATSGFRNILGDCALNYNYIAYGEIEKGEFGKYKVIFMPLSMSLSNAEIENLGKFVANGGILVADMASGHYDNHAVRKENRTELLKLFGLKSFGTLQKVKGKVNASGAELGKLSIPVEYIESGIAAASARPLAKATGNFGATDVFFVNNYGKGKAIYLAADISSTIGNQGALRYTSKHAKNTAELKKFFSSLTKTAGIEPLVQAPTLRSTELHLRENNGAYIIGFVRDIDQTRNTENKVTQHKVIFSKNFHVWDLLENKYMGYGKEFTYGFGPVTQSVWVALPYKPTALKADISGTGRARKIELSLQADTAEFTRHIINYRMKDPSGKVNPAYTGKLIMDDGKCSLNVKLPLNFPADGWTFEAEDVASGCKVITKL